ncbi:MAG: hypothetical protein HW421_762 [Ignavibacteria bacterium]|nr:hypothetical protein [Ignavibacteria bacterium]
MKKYLKIWGNNIKICFRILLTTAGIIVLMRLWGCNPCSNPTGLGCCGSGKTEIYFWGSTINNNMPSIYKISTDGKSLKEIIRNAKLFSRPSKNGMLAFLRNESGISKVMTANADGNDTSVVASSVESDFSTGINYPVISSDGSMVAFVCGDNQMYVVNKIVRRPFSGIMSRTIPSFSPKENSVAFLNYDLTSKLVTLKVYNVQNDDYILSKPIAVQMSTPAYEQTCEWSENGERISVSMSNDSTSIVYIVNIATAEMDSVNLKQQGAIAPALSYDGSSFVYTSKSGALWKCEITNHEPSLFQITQDDSTEKNIFGQWNPDGKSVIFSQFTVGEEQNPTATLKIVNVENNSSFGTFMLCNNSFRGFWGR